MHKHCFIIRKTFNVTVEISYRYGFKSGIFCFKAKKIAQEVDEKCYETKKNSIDLPSLPNHWIDNNTNRWRDRIHRKQNELVRIIWCTFQKILIDTKRSFYYFYTKNDEKGVRFDTPTFDRRLGLSLGLKVSFGWTLPNRLHGSIGETFRSNSIGRNAVIMLDSIEIFRRSSDSSSTCTCTYAPVLSSSTCTMIYAISIGFVKIHDTQQRSNSVRSTFITVCTYVTWQLSV